jgi:hypothetical protein
MLSHLHPLRTSVLLTLTLLAAGCATPDEPGVSPPVVQSTAAPDLGRHPIHKILIVAMHTRPDLRNPFEDAFARDLESRGIQAVPAHTLLPDPQQVNRERLTQEARRGGFDTVLIAGVIRRQNVVTLDPGVTVGDRGEFRPGYPALSYKSYDQAPSDTVEHEVILETKIFDANDASLLWCARTGPLTTTDVTPQLPDLAQSLTNKMQEDGLVPAPATAV